MGRLEHQHPEGERHHQQWQPCEPQQERTDQGRENGRRKAGEEHYADRLRPTRQGQPTRDKGPETEEHCMPQRKYAGESQQQVIRQHQQHHHQHRRAQRQILREHEVAADGGEQPEQLPDTPTMAGEDRVTRHFGHVQAVLR
ncbi:hypothetical protein D3C71_1555250 [compost metagenome]